MARGVWNQRRRTNIGGQGPVWRNPGARAFAGDGAGRESQKRFWTGAGSESDDVAADGCKGRRPTAAGIRRGRKSNCGQGISGSYARSGISWQSGDPCVWKAELRREGGGDRTGDDV